MKIGILTCPLGLNYGGILQAYALQTILERMGHKVNIIDYRKPLPPFYLYAIRAFKKYVCKQSVHIHVERDYRLLMETSHVKIKQFIDKYIHLFPIQNFKDIDANSFDAIVVGSDQIWRKPYFIHDYHTTIDKAFLSFTKKWEIKRFAYAASFGVNKWEYTEEETELCKVMAQQFDAISVREESGIKLCHQYLGCKAIHVLDPTLLLTREDYQILIKQNNPSKSEGNLLCYILDDTEQKTTLINRLAKKNGLQPFSVISNKHLEPKPSVESWLAGFNDTSFVITDSFHACIFSLIFNKPFLVVENKYRGLARIQSLLRIFKQEYRLVSEDFCADLTPNLTVPPNADIDLLKHYSFEFLNLIH